MESKSTQSQEMINLIMDIMSTIEIGNTGKEDRWYKYFSNFLEKLNRPHSLKVVAKELMSIYGGMGSFGDLVLHKNPITPLIEENDRLEELRHDLFILCESILDDSGS